MIRQFGGRYKTDEIAEFRSEQKSRPDKKVVSLITDTMSQVNFKLKEVINNTVDNKLKNYQHKQSIASFYEQTKNDASRVGRSSTYDVVGKRDYKTLFDEKKYKF